MVTDGVAKKKKGWEETKEKEEIYKFSFGDGSHEAQEGHK